VLESAGVHDFSLAHWRISIEAFEERQKPESMGMVVIGVFRALQSVPTGHGTHESSKITLPTEQRQSPLRIAKPSPVQITSPVTAIVTGVLATGRSSWLTT